MLKQARELSERNLEQGGRCASLPEGGARGKRFMVGEGDGVGPQDGLPVSLGLVCG